jgi:hypothetical protein
VVLDNIGGMPAPVDLQLSYSDGTSGTVHETPVIWQADQARATLKIPTRKTLASLKLEHQIWMDADTTNDIWSAGKHTIAH